MRSVDPHNPGPAGEDYRWRRPLRGRSVQSDYITEVLQKFSVADRRKTLVLEGAPGSGKSRLLLEAAAIAAGNGFSVVSGIPAPAGSAPDDAGALRFLRHVPEGERVTGTFTEKGLRDQLPGLAARRPALVHLDDLHLARPESLRPLFDLIAGMSAHPVVWILAFRSPQSRFEQEALQHGLDRIRTTQIPALSGLAGDAVDELVSDCVGAKPDAAVVTLARSVACTPRSVIELVHGLVEDGEVHVVDETTQLVRTPAEDAACDLFPSTGPWPEVPNRVVKMIHRRLEPLSSESRNVLQLGAVLGTAFKPDDLSKMLDRPAGHLLTTLDEALSRNLIVCHPDEFAFHTEAVWRVVFDTIPVPVRALLHRQAANVLLSRPDGIEAAATHLVHSAQPADTEAARIVSQGARNMLTSDPATAAALAKRGTELLEPGNDEWFPLVSTALEACILAGRPERAAELAETATKNIAASNADPESTPPAMLAAVQSWNSVALLMQGGPYEAVAAAQDALAVADGPFPHHGRAETVRLVAHSLTDDKTAVQRADEILCSEDSTQSVRVPALTVRALDYWRSARIDHAIHALEEATELCRDSADLQLFAPQWFLAWIHTKVGDPDRTNALLNALWGPAEQAPTGASSAPLAILRAWAHLGEGRIGDAEAEANAGIATMSRRALPLVASQAWSALAMAALRRGDLATAAAQLKTLEERFPRDTSRPWWAMHFLLNAQLADAAEGPHAAIKALSEILANATARRELVLETPGAAAWCVRAALAADSPEVARTVVDTVRAVSERNENWPTVCAGALHARGLYSHDVEALHQATGLYRDPWARASVLEDRGTLLSHDDSETAIADLEQAIRTYTELGSERDAARIRKRLRHLGVRRRHWSHASRPESGRDSLTKTEHKVAQLVAKGLTNRQVAGQMFISAHTVGFHLRQIYRKLHISSRIDLIRERF